MNQENKNYREDENEQTFNEPLSPKMEELMKKSTISLFLDEFDDIFSDFDPRPYQERGLSDDFISEAKKIARENKPGKLELHFLIPKAAHNLETENTIKKRLHQHFKREETLIKKATKKNIKKGFLYLLVGFILMIINSFINFQTPTTFILSLIQVCFEPASWFIVWRGFDFIFNSQVETKAEVEFHQKMAKAEIIFEVY